MAEFCSDRSESGLKSSDGFETAWDDWQQPLVLELEALHHLDLDISIMISGRLDVPAVLPHFFSEAFTCVVSCDGQKGLGACCILEWLHGEAGPSFRHQ